MSRILADLLGLPKEEVSGWITQLEHKAGYPSQDVRLLAAQEKRVRDKIVQLGLDPDDTTGEELYATLVARYDRDCQLVNKALGVDGSSGWRQQEAIALRLLDHLAADSTVWAVKSAVVKGLLKDQPPKKTMKLWRYRSVSSLFKRCDPAEIVLAANINESPAWQKNFNGKLSKVKDSDHVLQTVRTLRLNGSHFGKTRGLRAVSDARLGVVALYPSEGTNLQVLTAVLLLTKELEKICLRLDLKPLAVISPTLGWWADTASLLSWNNGRPISLNIHDIAIAHGQQSAYGEQSTEHGAAALVAELVNSYEQYIENLPAELKNIGQRAGTEIQQVLSPVNQLALEAVEV